MTNDVTKMSKPMNKEEMIDTLKGLVFGTFDRTTAKEREALDMVIKEVEQQPITWIVGKDNCQVAVRNMPIDKMQKICAIIGEEEQQLCEDAISREAVVNWLEICTDDSIEHAIESNLEFIPSVTPQPKVGHWITTRTFMHDGEYYCDKCKCDSPNNEKWDFCPNCGAKMEVE